MSATACSSEILQKLVSHILQKPSSDVTAEVKKARKMLDISPSRYENNEFVLCEKIKMKLSISNNSDTVKTFETLFRQLRASQSLKNRVGILHFLYALSERDTKKTGPDLSATINPSDIIRSQTLSNDFANFQNICSKSTQKQKGGKSVHRGDKNKSSSDEHVMNGRHNGIERALLATSEESNLGSISGTIPNLQILLRDLLFAFQGLKCNCIHWDPETENFNVQFEENFPNPIKRLALRFIELGVMYCRINQYCNLQNEGKSVGIIAQSFVAALKLKLVDYYRFIAELEASLMQETTLEHLSSDVTNNLTLHRMSARLFEPHLQMKILASLVETCKGKQGGALLSVLYAHLQHGDPDVRSLINDLLSHASQPLFKILVNWICCGELEDKFCEFFVIANSSVYNTCLWQEKYSLNKEMIPSFLTKQQAKKILSTGKAINFLHEACQDTAFVRNGDQRMRALDSISASALFSQDKDSAFENILEKNYTRASKAVLQVLHDKYNLMDHLMAMRNYFLLGQGDFIRHLMDLLDSELAKPAQSLQTHNLTASLEVAIRGTNAQFHNSEVLQRLDVRPLEAAAGDTGWDVFCLDYRVDGPIQTIFTPDCMNSYLRLFTTLWQAKHMEFLLNKISLSCSSYLKIQTRIPEVAPVVYNCHAILAQMVHFVQQVQYYMAFEVMECCWADLLSKINLAQDLDEVIMAHESFLDTLLTRTLLNEESLLLRTQLKIIYDLIVDFERIQGIFWAEVDTAIKKLDELDELVQSNTSKSTWGIREEESKDYREPLNYLKLQRVPRTQADLKILFNSYEDMVQKFLLMLNNEDDPNLKFLSFRLDFNEHFKKKSQRLHNSLTYQNRRKSLNRTFM